MGYQFPSITLLSESHVKTELSREKIMDMANEIVRVMDMWNTHVRIVDIKSSPLSTCFEVMPEAGESIKKVAKLKADLELHLASGIEILDHTSGKNSITVVALPKERPLISLRSILEMDEFTNAPSPLTVAAGFNYDGHPLLIDIAELPHMLIAGTTGSGKTAFIDNIIMSILYKAHPDDVKLILIDPKMVDLIFYNQVPHLLAPVVYEERAIFGMLSWVEDEMMRRYETFASVGLKSIDLYNKGHIDAKMSKIVVIIDEYAELMASYRKEFEDIIDRLARLGRAAGIHLIIATQRPTSDVLTGTIKSNLPCRVSFTVVDSRESNAIINRAGAQKLLGAGDMFFSMSSSSGTEHAQAAYVELDDIKKVVRTLAN
jgi:S-DNA-T family DNA segregation ATPase FtsK/SpoIIIE